jgi:pyruvate/2-oxoglutarate dehydrogenase complex dihydrolipoamide acyltransferase (E2) component
VWASSTALTPTTTTTTTTATAAATATTTATAATATATTILPGASSTRGAPSAAALESPYVRRIARVEENAWFDLICQVPPSH